MTRQDDIEASFSGTSDGKGNSKGGGTPITTLSPAGSAQQLTPFNNPFDDATVRRRFLSKVFGILSTMLLITFAFMAVFVFVEPAKKWMLQYGLAVSTAASGFYFATSCVLICCSQSVGRTVPWNYILLTIFTLSTAAMFTPVVVLYDLQSILLSLGITVLLVFLVAALSATTSFDFTRHVCVISLMIMGFVFASLIMFLVAGFTGAPPNWLLMVQAAGGVAVFTLSLAMEVQLIVGGRRFAYSEEDYVLANINIYLDIMYIFFYLLQLVGGGGGRRA